MLSLKDRILLTLAVAGDILEDIGTVGGLVAVPSKEIYGFIPPKHQKHNFSASLSYALKTREIEKIVKNGEVFFRLTGCGEKKLIRDFPLVSFQKKPWDGKWRVLIYDIPENKKKTRDLLRRKIVSLGFGQLQKSVYISPYKIEKEMADFLNSNRLSKLVLFLISDNILAGGDKFLAEQVWHLTRINYEYEQILKELRALKVEEEKKIRTIRARYLEVVARDPFLPKDLLPTPWYGEEVIKAMDKHFK